MVDKVKIGSVYKLTDQLAADPSMKGLSYIVLILRPQQAHWFEAKIIKVFGVANGRYKDAKMPVKTEELEIIEGGLWEVLYG